MYIITEIYDKGLLVRREEFSYKTSQEYKEYKELCAAMKTNMALLSLSGNN